MSGSGSGGGFDFQAASAAFVGAHIVAQSPLRWFERPPADAPIGIDAETAGPGDDFAIWLGGGGRIEVQAKRGLDADDKNQKTGT